jgi:hypothetical protein
VRIEGVDADSGIDAEPVMARQPAALALGDRAQQLRRQAGAKELNGYFASNKLSRQYRLMFGPKADQACRLESPLRDQMEGLHYGMIPIGLGARGALLRPSATVRPASSAFRSSRGSITSS